MRRSGSGCFRSLLMCFCSMPLSHCVCVFVFLRRFRGQAREWFAAGAASPLGAKSAPLWQARAHLRLCSRSASPFLFFAPPLFPLLLEAWPDSASLILRTLRPYFSPLCVSCRLGALWRPSKATATWPGHSSKKG